MLCRIAKAKVCNEHRHRNGFSNRSKREDFRTIRFEKIK